MSRPTSPAQLTMFAADSGNEPPRYINGVMTDAARAAFADAEAKDTARRWKPAPRQAAAALDIVAPPPAPMIADADAATVNAIVAHHLAMVEGMSERNMNQTLRGIAKTLRRMANTGKSATGQHGTLTPATMREAAAILDAMA